MRIEASIYLLTIAITSMSDIVLSYHTFANVKSSNAFSDKNYPPNFLNFSSLSSLLDYFKDKY